MSGNLKYLLFYTNSSGLLYEGDKEIFNLFSRISQETDFQVTTASLGRIFSSTGISDYELFMKAWEELKRESSPVGIAIEFEDEFGFELSIGIESSGNPWIYLFFDDSHVSSSTQRAEQIIREIIHVSELIYDVLSPEYGFGMVSPHRFSFVDLHQRPPTISAIHDFNLLSRSIVLDVGVDQLISIPSWKTIRFQDGGMFIIMSPNPIAEWQEYEAKYLEAAEILGVKEIFQGG